eukprot:CAMPEP_0202687282 /NCGR_PEP_ID=MMETSP1385-20130828/2979_1 /ASSEMBLY_ACC=CAM_ASM_000861 /TAXON_ID=933848 /ORGANISM="Elphidium margaritaceum" /LENGTH=489 /DNA_ID=CAMNT_0049342049 /DNA_START=9 /DNA_END=1478 /DNA_ORIENTATION=-
MSSTLKLLDRLITFCEADLSQKNTKSTTAMSAKVERKEEIEQDVHGGGNKSLKEVDPEIFTIIKAEEERQRTGLELIASENFTSMAVMEAVGSCLTNKYSEGLPGKRYYGGNEEIDKLEILCQKRALQAFGLNDQDWWVNVQPYSGSVANFAAFTALLKPNDRFMGLFLPDGGHLSHGFYRGHKSINISSTYFQCLPYYVDVESGYIDYDDLARQAKRFCPKLIVGGSSAYPRDWDYKRLREIADSVKARLLVDMAHFSGLVAAGVVNSPFAYADVVTTTTHKSLRATRAAMVFCKKELAAEVNSAIFPGTQGGPHNHAIAGVAVALREAQSVEFRAYAKQVVLNARALAKELVAMGYKIVTGGTDTHLLLWDLRPNKVSGSKVEYVCDLANITINKNTVHGDKSALSPGGVRVGTPALTTRGFKEDDFKQVAKILDTACKYAIDIQSKCASTKMAEFKPAAEQYAAIKQLRQQVVEFASKFPIPGVKL